MKVGPCIVMAFALAIVGSYFSASLVGVVVPVKVPMLRPLMFEQPTEVRFVKGDVLFSIGHQCNASDSLWCATSCALISKCRAVLVSHNLCTFFSSVKKAQAGPGTGRYLCRFPPRAPSLWTVSDGLLDDAFKPSLIRPVFQPHGNETPAEIIRRFKNVRIHSAYSLMPSNNADTTGNFFTILDKPVSMCLAVCLTMKQCVGVTYISHNMTCYGRRLFHTKRFNPGVDSYTLHLPFLLDDIADLPQIPIWKRQMEKIWCNDFIPEWVRQAHHIHGVQWKTQPLSCTPDSIVETLMKQRLEASDSRKDTVYERVLTLPSPRHCMRRCMSLHTCMSSAIGAKLQDRNYTCTLKLVETDVKDRCRILMFDPGKLVPERKSGCLTDTAISLYFVVDENNFFDTEVLFDTWATDATDCMQMCLSSAECAAVMYAAQEHLCRLSRLPPFSLEVNPSWTVYSFKTDSPLRFHEDTVVGVLAAPQYIEQRLKPSLETWLFNVTSHILLESEESKNKIENFIPCHDRKCVKAHHVACELPPGGATNPNNFNGAWKNAVLLSHLATDYSHYKWFILADDDSFIIPPNLDWFLAAMSSPAKERVLLHTGWLMPPGAWDYQGYVSGSAGIFSNEEATIALRLWGELCRQYEVPMKFGDIRMGNCADLAGIVPFYMGRVVLDKVFNVTIQRIPNHLPMIGLHEYRNASTFFDLYRRIVSLEKRGVKPPYSLTALEEEGKKLEGNK